MYLYPTTYINAMIRSTSEIWSKIILFASFYNCNFVKQEKILGCNNLVIPGGLCYIWIIYCQQSWTTKQMFSVRCTGSNQKLILLLPYFIFEALTYAWRQKYQCYIRICYARALMTQDTFDSNALFSRATSLRDRLFF